MFVLGLIASLVEACRRHAGAVLAAAILFSLGCGWYTATHLDIDTDTNNLISPELPWRQRETVFEKAFPQNTDLLAIVIDGRTADQAEDASGKIAERLMGRKDLFRTVRRPDGGEFFLKNGSLFLPTADVQELADQLIAAQPMIGALAADPSLRGLFDALDLAAQGIIHGQAKIEVVDKPFTAIADAVQSALDGKPQPLSWQMLFTGRPPEPQELRRFVLAQPVLDYSALEPGGKSTAFIRDTAKELGFTSDHGVSVRITGPVALSDEEFASVAQGAGFATLLSLGLVCLWLFMALRSWRLVVAILGTLAVGLVATGAFAAVAVGKLNMISVAFAVLFIGIAVDFGIQFGVRFRDERHRSGDTREALERAARGVGGPLAVAAATTAVGFLAFVPTDYSGVSDLGLIAGVSMLIALFLNLSVLPALLALLKPPPEKESVGFQWAAPLDRLLLRRRFIVIGIAALLGVGSALLLPKLQFDFDPLNLKDPKTESMATLRDLMADPITTPYTIDVLTASPQEAAALAEKLDKLPEVAQAVTISSYVPEDQDAKIAILEDAAMLLGPTLSPSRPKPAPSDAETLASIAHFAADLKEAKPPAGSSGERLLRLVEQVGVKGVSIVPALRESLVGALAQRLDLLRLMLQPEKVTHDTLPADLKSAWVAQDGRARIEVFPKGDPRDRAVLTRFISSVRSLVPEATGMPVSIQESGRTVVSAFLQAGLIAVGAIAILLFVVLRRAKDVAMVLIPLVLAALLTAATSIASGLPLNFANIITLPLLLGIGVAFDIYFVMNWRAGMTGLLQSATARAVLFSALTTTTAFGSLALSNHPGTSEMGKLLTISLFYTLVCTLFVLPALLGSPPDRK